jgi:pyruvate kinase
MVAMRVTAKPPTNDCLVCVVEHGGRLRSRQGINLPGARLRVPALTPKDHEDLAWAIENELDYVGLSFVRSPDDISALRTAMARDGRAMLPAVVAKIEKMEAVSALEAILAKTDAVMVARGDLGVEVDIALVPGIQKRIIRVCNEHGVPVITATQMLESMQKSELPTRAEASDVANAVLDGSDAIMLSGETAVGDHPALVVATMSRIAFEAERLLRGRHRPEDQQAPRSRAQPVTEAVTVAARAAAEHLAADLLVVASRTGKTAMAMSSQRGHVPILALSDQPDTARRMCLYWGVTSLEAQAMRGSPEALLNFVVAWGKQQGVLKSGSRIVFVGTTDWTAGVKDLMLVHMVA